MTFGNTITGDRTVDERWRFDTEYERVKIAKVTAGREYFDVLREDGWSLGVPDVGIEPEVGDWMRCYGKGIGYQVRGIVIEGKGVVRYDSPAEFEARREQENRERQDKKQTALDEGRSARDLRIRELPRPLRLRIEGFQAAREHWRRDHEEYELFVCEEAAKIAQHFEGPNAVYNLNAWAELKYDEQRQAWDGMDGGHSGNTWGAAVALGRALLLGNEDYVIRAHGALCPLVGCEDYGCYPARSGDGVAS